MPILAFGQPPFLIFSRIAKNGDFEWFLEFLNWIDYW